MLTNVFTFVIPSLLCASIGLSADSVSYTSSNVKPPTPLREFRGAWVATVGNIDWPSQPGLPTAQQMSELLAILDRAVELRLNAIILQVRPSCDALYVSRLEPWSEYLSGRMGQGPNPPYDPLAFAVEEAHKRGLELHAWFNPYRARTPSARSPVSNNHISKERPNMVKSYGGYLWLDPGDTNVQAYILRVMLDVLRRYDVDGIHIDDYFYPPPQKDVAGKILPFPDWSSWRGYLAGGGRLSREDWRRENVNNLVQTMYRAIKSEKPHVKFGVSPSGIWRPGTPPQIKGFDPYALIYADSRKWFANGWLDYFAPQLYWEIQAPGQSYPVLLKWWSSQNLKERHLWPGNAVSRLASGRPATEILNQIQLTRQEAGAGGNILWNFKPLLVNQGNIVAGLKDGVYEQPALVPASPWLSRTQPPQPICSVVPMGTSNLKLNWRAGNSNEPALWLLQTKVAAGWGAQVLPGQQHTWTVSSLPQVVALSAVDRFGNASTPCAFERVKSVQP